MPTSSQDCCLGVFAKHWTPGAVKTRLAADIGASAAAALHRTFLATTLERLGEVRATQILSYWPPSQADDFAKLSPNWQVMPQTSGQLGDRLRAFFEAQIAAGFQRIVVVGADSPNLPAAYVQQAFQRLEEFPVVVGPSEDGGYYLIGATLTPDAALREIPWGSSDVWKTTIERLAAAGIPYATLPSWYDVDRLPDLVRLQADLHQSREECPHLRSLGDVIGDIMSTLDASRQPHT